MMSGWNRELSGATEPRSSHAPSGSRHHPPGAASLRSATHGPGRRRACARRPAGPAPGARSSSCSRTARSARSSASTRARSPRRFFEVCRPRLLHLIDPWLTSRYGDPKHDVVARRFSDEIAAGQVVIHRASSLDALPALPDASLGWAYIDTDHMLRDHCGRAPAPREEGRTRRDNRRPRLRHGQLARELPLRSGGGRERVLRERRWRFIGLTHETDRHLSFALQGIDGR